MSFFSTQKQTKGKIMELSEAQKVVIQYEELTELIESKAHLVFDSLYPNQHHAYFSFESVENGQVTLEERFRENYEYHYFPLELFFRSEEQLKQDKDGTLEAMKQAKLEAKKLAEKAKKKAEKQKEIEERQLFEELQKKYNSTN